MKAPSPVEPPHGLSSSLLVIAAGVSAALHVGKLPPAIGALQQSLGLSLIEAGFLLSLVQLAGMTAAIAVGAWADSLGLKRSMVLGLAILAVASVGGGLASGPAPLLALRAIEGFGFLLVVLPAPALVRELAPPGRINQVLGLWGAYMPFGTALGLLLGPLWIEGLGWRTWWWAVAALSAAMAAVLAVAVPALTSAHSTGPSLAWPVRLRRTLASTGPWLVALAFAAYSSQWLAVIGFLPKVYEQAGVSVGMRGVLTAAVAAVNMAGNVGGGRLLHRGAAPHALLAIGFVAMAVSALIAFAGADDRGASPAARYVALLGFSLLGGLIPTALFAMALRVAPDERTISTTVGWVQQWSAFGQFVGPPVVAWVASQYGGWHWTWAATGSMSLLGLLLTWRIARLPGP
jgi:MFS family permease